MENVVHDLKALWFLVIGQGAVLLFLGIRKMIEYKAKRADAELEDGRAAKKREITTLDTLLNKLLELEPMIRTTKIEMDLYREYIMGIPKMREDLVRAFKWLKEAKPPNGHDNDPSSSPPA